MSKHFNKLPPKPEYLVAIKGVLQGADELKLRDITRLARLSQTQTFSALDSLVSSGEVGTRRQGQPPTVHYRLVIRSP